MSTDAEVRPDEARWQAWRDRWYASPIAVPDIVRCAEQYPSDEKISGPFTLHLKQAS
jgi:hypothetical protein